MKKLSAYLVLSTLFLALPLSFAAADSAMDVRIDYKMNVAKEDYTANYFNWTVGKQAAVKDKFDTASGASVKGSTKAFNTVRYAEPETDKKSRNSRRFTRFAFVSRFKFRCCAIR